MPRLPSTAPQAIVTDGLWRKSLSAIRSLKKAGYQVTVLGDSWLSTGLWSSGCSRRVIAPSAAQDPEAFGQALLDELARARQEGGPKPVLLAMEDASVRWASRHSERIAELCDVLLPGEESLEIAWDKARTTRLAEELALPCPRSWEPASAAELESLARSLAPGTFVAKPRSGSGSAGVVYGVAGFDWRAHWERFGAMLVQERVSPSGVGVGVSLLYDRSGNRIAAFAHRRLQQYPNSGGPSTDRESILAPGLIEMSARLLERLQWRGVAMVEWKLDPEDGDRPKLMEINPRFWGSLELAVRSGVDFPKLYAEAASGRPLEPVKSYQAGVRTRWMMPGELLRWLTQNREKRESLRQFCRGLPTLAEEWDLSDLRGTLATILCTALLALNPKYWRYVRRG